MPRLVPWLDERRPDVVCLQETKLADVGSPSSSATSSRRAGTGRRPRRGGVERGRDHVAGRASTTSTAGLPVRPGSPTPRRAPSAATCDGVRVHWVYVPNGRAPDSDHYEYKLAWLARAAGTVVAAAPRSAVVCGDMNIAPADIDVFDPDAYVGQTHVTPPEREALAQLQTLGLHDVVRERWPTERVFTYWDYRAGMFHQDLGMRIDLMLAGDAVAHGSGRPGSTARPARAAGRATMRR